MPFDSHPPYVAALKLHLAPIGADIPRWSPAGFSFPIWSDADVARDPHPRVSTRTGQFTLVDRRKPWQRELVNFSVSRCGSIVRPLKSAADAAPFRLADGTAT